MKDFIKLLKDISVMIVFGIIFGIFAIFALFNYTVFWAIRKVFPNPKSRRVTMDEACAVIGDNTCPECNVNLLPIQFSGITEHECPDCGYMNQDL